jgi:hypothetical protein
VWTIYIYTYTHTHILRFLTPACTTSFFLATAVNCHLIQQPKDSCPYGLHINWIVQVKIWIWTRPWSVTCSDHTMDYHTTMSTKQNSACSHLRDGKVPAMHLWWSHFGGRQLSQGVKWAVTNSQPLEPSRLTSIIPWHLTFRTVTYLLTYSMQQSPSWKPNWFSASQETPHILWNLKVHYPIHTCLPPVPILGFTSYRTISPVLRLSVWTCCNITQF